MIRKNTKRDRLSAPQTDGAKVPIFITCKRGLDLNGDNPAIMYAYGGYSFSQTPSYREWMPVWLENGGIFVVANIRGGNEYGEAWHRAGMFAGRQKTYDDIHAAAEWLIANRYTSNRKLAIEGRSNGGLLVAVCVLQRPDLYGAIYAMCRQSTCFASNTSLPGVIGPPNMAMPNPARKSSNF